MLHLRITSFGRYFSSKKKWNGFIDSFAKYRNSNLNAIETARKQQSNQLLFSAISRFYTLRIDMIDLFL